MYSMCTLLHTIREQTNSDIFCNPPLWFRQITCVFLPQNLATCISMQFLLLGPLALIDSKHLRLCRSRSSVSKSKRGCWTSVGPWDWRTEDEEEMTVVWPEGWMVLNWNCGPIHRRRWGPVWVTISTCGYKGNGEERKTFLVFKTRPKSLLWAKC